MIKIYPPTKEGSKEMFDDFEKGDFDRKERLENARDISNELEIEASLEAKNAYDEKLEAEAREQTDNEEYLKEMELREQEKVDYGELDRNSL